ncbi:PIPK domain-containing protein [Abortiporus biennis]
MATTATTPPIQIPRTTSPASFDDAPLPSAVSTSATSYLTAPQSAHNSRPPSARLSQSPSSSMHTLNPKDTEGINPLHTLALNAANKSQPQEVHIVKVTDDVVHLHTGPVPESIFHKVGNSIVHAVLPLERRPDSRSERQQPSEPRSDSAESNEDSTAPSPSTSATVPSPTPNTQSIPGTRPVTFEDRVIDRDRQSAPSSRLISKSYSTSRAIAPSLTRRSSGDTRSSLRTTSTSTITPRISRTSNQSDGTTASESPLTDDHDGYLHPPPPPKPSRRNTTGSAFPGPSTPPPPAAASTSSRPGRMSTIQSFPHTLDGVEVGEELASDIQLQAEQIRRERMSKKAKAAAEAEAAKAQEGLTRTTSVRDDNPLVGNVIGEGHVNYVLMYNMLTGIRTAFSRWQAKARRPLTEEDFTACHKYSFDIIGNELTPSAKYDFKFKDYSPWVFRELREDYFHIEPADYLVSLTAKYILSELGSPGKSGSFFYFSRDYRFIIKTIHHNEHKFLRRILKEYYNHVKNNPHTLLSRFYGLHRVKLPRGRKIHFVIMNNLFPPHKDIHETYDLKGSTVGREYPEEKAQKNPRAVLKDLNWINRGKTLELGPEKRALLTEQLRRDSELLKRLYVMDYSLLVGIHNMQRGNKDNVRRNTLKVFSPEIHPLTRRKKTQSKGPSSPEAIALRRIMRESDPVRLDSAGPTIQLPDEDIGGERQYFIFYQDEGGLRATDETNGDMDTIYYLGVIDILTPYTTFKKLEHFWKGLKADRHKISPVPPVEYGNRFFSFMKAIMRGGEGGAKFKSE